jgi:ABC-type transporter Mla subunit MlaD
MATPTTTLQELDRRLKKVERQLAAQAHGARPKAKAGRSATRSVRNRQSATNSALEIARHTGLLAELPPEAQARIERWRALPEEERQEILNEFYNLPLDPSLSDVIVENRQ